MAFCNVCGKELESSKPMVLAGQKLFIKPAGNGARWVGAAPAVRYWKTFALLSVGVCPECVERRKKQKIRNYIISIIVLFLLALIDHLTNLTNQAFLYILGIAGIVVLYNFIAWLAKYKYSDETNLTVLHHYLSTNKIPKEHICAIVGQEEGTELQDINVRETMGELHYFNSSYDQKKYLYDLQLFPIEELSNLGKYRIANETEQYAQNLGLEEARMNARRLFEKIGISFEI